MLHVDMAGVCVLVFPQTRWYFQFKAIKIYKAPCEISAFCDLVNILMFVLIFK